MATLAFNFDDWTSDTPRGRMAASIAISVVAHLLLLVSIGVLVRAMPATIPRQHASEAALVATLTPPATLPHLLPLLSAQELPALKSMLPLEFPAAPPDVAAPVSQAESKPLLNTPLAGVAINPATTVIDELFAPVGRISSTVGNGREHFGNNISARMAERFPDIAVRTPTPIGSLSALYPARAARDGRSQRISALLFVDRAGTVTEARVMPDDPAFSAAVIAALKTAKFTPAEFSGKAIPYWVVLEFRFSIDGPTGPNGVRLDR